MLAKREHFSVIEHAYATVKFTTDRGVTHEVVRHRLASFSQESTRYVNYAGDLQGSQISVSPMFDNLTDAQIARREELYAHCERVYMAEIDEKIKPQQARDNLPTCTKTEIIVTANIREWGHIFKQRTSSGAHPRMQQLMRPLLEEFKRMIPVIYEDLSKY